ncbi:Protein DETOXIFICATION 44, chloroplastic [Zea mays]|uniref:Protein DETOXIFICATION 44, chloroplastic n=2 Tax=Zea mays TaxID=4577 RepID=A0A8J8YAE0_MAIZE|nr:saposin B domain-containing protein [Zea mays]PWZ39961.1 Protein DETOXIFICATION 44, chloroplastic [Zea mays]
MDSYATLLFPKIMEIKPEAFCKQFALCRNTTLFSGVRSESTCVFCHHLFDEIMSKLKDRDVEFEIIQILIKECSKIEGHVTSSSIEVCMSWLIFLEGLKKIEQIIVDSALVETNMVFFDIMDLGMSPGKLCQIGGVTGIALGVALFFGFGSFSVLFTNDPAVLGTAKSRVWFVTVSQPINAIAFVMDGLYYCVSDLAYVAYSVFFVGAVSSAFLLSIAPKLGVGMCPDSGPGIFLSSLVQP